MNRASGREVGDEYGMYFGCSFLPSWPYRKNVLFLRQRIETRYKVTANTLAISYGFSVFVSHLDQQSCARILNIGEIFLCPGQRI